QYPTFLSINLRRQPSSPLFPYTTLFRSLRAGGRLDEASLRGHGARARDLRAARGADGRRDGGRERAGEGKRFSLHRAPRGSAGRSEEHTSELQSRGHLVCRLLLEKKKPG